jgi:hypothetical protein
LCDLILDFFRYLRARFARDRLSSSVFIASFRSTAIKIAPIVHCREINAADEDGVVSLLARRSRRHNRDFWIRAFRSIKAHGVVPGYPEYGYLLDRDGTVVGVLLLIFRSKIVSGEVRVSCNVSRWRVEPDARI